jgi:hypothetical protein
MMMPASKYNQKHPYSKRALQRYFKWDRKSLKDHVNNLQQKYNWQNARDWAFGDFLSWYAANCSPAHTYKSIRPKIFSNYYNFDGFNIDDFDYVISALGINNQIQFYKFRRLFSSLEKIDPEAYRNTMARFNKGCIDSKKIADSTSLSIDELKYLCVKSKIWRFETLAKTHPKAANTLYIFGWDQPWFWNSVHILQKLRPLPENFDPLESMLLLSWNDLKTIGYTKE